MKLKIMAIIIALATALPKNVMSQVMPIIGPNYVKTNDVETYRLNSSGIGIEEIRTYIGVTWSVTNGTILSSNSNSVTINGI